MQGTWVQSLVEELRSHMPGSEYVRTLQLTMLCATQACPALNPMDYSVREILQARILEWVAFPFPRGSSQPRDRTQVSASLSAEPQDKSV